jgi:hypothetical protein
MTRNARAICDTYTAAQMYKSHNGDMPCCVAFLRRLRRTMLQSLCVNGVAVNSRPSTAASTACGVPSSHSHTSPLSGPSSGSRPPTASVRRQASVPHAAKGESCIPTSLLGQFEAMPYEMIERIERRHELQRGLQAAQDERQARKAERLRRNMSAAAEKAQKATAAAQRHITALKAAPIQFPNH